MPKFADLSASPIDRLLDAQHSIERIGGLIDQRFRPVLIRVEVLERQVALVVDLFEGIEDGGPVGGSIQQRPE